MVTRRGSSPRARGTHDGPDQLRRRQRFIPASAGNTGSAGGVDRLFPVHPRERGEHLPGPAVAGREVGSSPRARGTRQCPNLRVCDQRFIPASAGNTTSLNFACSTAAVHPRERGEHRKPVISIARSTGSSPRARGTRPAHHPGGRGQRFIPASAGNTAGLLSKAICWSVHPRERGEHSLSMVVRVGDFGSSPRARGTLGGVEFACDHQRFIPASAGNTGRTLTSESTPSVHPRERGEHPALPDADGQQGGSSPRARGTHQQG